MIEPVFTLQYVVYVVRSIINLISDLKLIFFINSIAGTTHRTLKELIFAVFVDFGPNRKIEFPQNF